ncbi:MAG: hydrogenase expression protein [Thermomicrobiales bacterium]|nr:hydrogenase expression protein [Thermomicrobiales bacterium]
MDLLGKLLSGALPTDDRVLVGPGVGRDAAVLDFGETRLVIKSDPITFASDSAPLYLVSVNANDLACLGATPRWLMVTALLPEGATTTASVESMFGELVDACRSQDISLIGGHTEITSGLDRPILVGTMIGETTAAGLIEPGCGQPGDRLVLTRPIAVEGTALIARELRDQLSDAFDDDFLDRCASLLVDPGISIASHARALIATGGVSALHDPTEGGLASGIREIAVAAGCGAVINRDRVPVLPETAALCDHFGLDPLGLLASGSLLAAVRPENVPDLEALTWPDGSRPVVIGKLAVPERGFDLVSNGAVERLPLFATDEYARLIVSLS